MGSDPELIEFAKTQIIQQHSEIFESLQPISQYEVKFLYPRGVGVDPHTAQTAIRMETADSPQFTLYRIEPKAGYIVVEFERL